MTPCFNSALDTINDEVCILSRHERPLSSRGLLERIGLSADRLGDEPLDDLAGED